VIDRWHLATLHGEGSIPAERGATAIDPMELDHTLNSCNPCTDFGAPHESGPGTQRHSPSPAGASPLLGVERSHFIWAQPGRISTARDPGGTLPARKQRCAAFAIRILGDPMFGLNAEGTARFVCARFTTSTLHLIWTVRPPSALRRSERKLRKPA